MTRILVIEDDEFNRQYILDILEAENYHVEIAQDGSVGLEVLERYTPDLILCDVSMPNVDGYGVLKATRQKKHTAALPFIFLTALAERDQMRTGMELGADDYLTKPFTPSDLVAAVKTQLRKHATRKQEFDTTLKLLRKNIIYALPHEIRTPMLKILGYAELMRTDADKLSPDEVASWSGTILSAGNRLNRMLENYLVYAQIELIANDPDEREALRNHITQKPNDLISDTAMEISAKYQRYSDLHLDLIDRAFRIAKDDLKKIVTEVVDNAFKFSESGTPVMVKTFTADDSYHVNVVDMGRGIDPEDVSRMGAYMQFERALYEQQGLGLGITIAKRLVELHGGQFIVKSKPGEGTHITMAFPLY